jgi:DNA repair protein RadA/Sms
LGLSTFIVGHVTKGGSIAGPKVLEHMVDAVLQLTGERSGRLRLLRAMKNRFGAVDEVGVYEMTEAGLAEVTDPSGIFLEGLKQGVPGSCVTVVMEGTRPMCAEIQALVVPSNIPTPRRVVEGVKKSRVEVLCAVLQKRAGIKLYDKDVFINVTGGLKINEPAADLAICLAIASSVKDQGLPKDVAAFGEVGLLGEVRNVFYGDRREKEAKKMGYERYVSSKTGREVGGLIKQMVGKGEE